VRFQCLYYMARLPIQRCIAYVVETTPSNNPRMSQFYEVKFIILKYVFLFDTKFCLCDFKQG
jgi:hypothetical protein